MQITLRSHTQAADRKRVLEKTRTLQSREKAINDRCKDHNPNAALDPEDRMLERYGVSAKSTYLHRHGYVYCVSPFFFYVWSMRIA
jgi:hypothetical protein